MLNVRTCDTSFRLTRQVFSPDAPAHPHGFLLLPHGFPVLFHVFRLHLQRFLLHPKAAELLRHALALLPEAAEPLLEALALHFHELEHCP